MSSQIQGQTILGNYRVGSNIGQGTFGKVKLGIHILTEQKVAIKTLQKQKIVQQSDIQRVTRQICILKILRHPNIIQLYEIIQTKTDIHLIMQYAQGGQLFDYIVKRKRLDESEAIRFMQQIIAGVEYIHKNGIVHRDLKPENLLLDHNKNIKIVDFGLSNQYKPGEKLKTACGSPCYAAPEMIAGKRYECLNADIWSCGIILYAMLCGYLPFQDPNTNKLYRKIIAGDFQMPKILSPEAKDILKNILNVNPQTRFKIDEIRQSKWYNLTNAKYESKGIIVGKDHIEPNEQIVRKMETYNIDPIQARTYIMNNRHNHTTALYYLMQIKMQREGKSLLLNLVENGGAKEQIQTHNVPKTGQETKKNAVGVSKIDHNIIKINNDNNSNNNYKTVSINNNNDNTILKDKDIKEKDNNKQKRSQQKEQKKRQGSPLIYRPDKKPQYYIPYGKKPNNLATRENSTKNNDSLNMSNIISSLVEANKNKLINKVTPSTIQVKKNDYFNKLQQFKEFPNKKNSSIYEPSSASKMSTSRSKNDDRSFEFNNTRNSLNSSENRKYQYDTMTSGFGLVMSQQYSKQRSKDSVTIENVRDTPREQEPTNRTRQQFSDQLRQISIKIDQEINQLRKQSASNTYNSRDSINVGGNSHNVSTSYPSTDRKRGEGPRFNPNLSGSKEGYPSRQSINTSQMSQSREMSRDYQTRESLRSQNIGHNSGQLNESQLKVHIGPFNTQCMFMQNARSLISRISSFLSKNSIRFSQPEPYNLLMADGQKISIQAIQGIQGVHLVKFSCNSNMQFNESVIEVLSK